MERKSILFLGVLALITPIFFSKLSAQSILWDKSHGGQHAEYLFDAISTPDYGFILAGSSVSGKTGSKESVNKGDFDYWIYKMNEKGDQEWQKSFGGNGQDFLKNIKLTSDGGFILGGTSNSSLSADKKSNSFGEEDIWVIKLDAKGEEIWQANLGGKGHENISQILLTNDGGYLVAGSTNSREILTEEEQKDKNRFNQASFGGWDYWLIKLSKSGQLEWQKSFGGNADDVLTVAEKTKDGFIIGGYSSSNISGNKTNDSFGKNDFWFLKIDFKGNKIWEKELGGSDEDYLKTIVVDHENNLIIAGSSNSKKSITKSKDNDNGYDFWIAKIKENGDDIWQKTFDIGKEDVFSSIVVNADNTMLISGYSKSELPISQNNSFKKKDKKGINDYYTIKINPEGDKLWERSIGSNGDEVLIKTFETRDGGYVLVGTSNGSSSGDKSSSNGGSDFWIVKLKDENKPEVEKIPLETFPNPAKTFTNVVIGYDYIEGEANIFDLNGRLLNSYKLNGNKTLPVNVSNYPTGVYIIEMVTNQDKHSIKLIKE